jgi:hypothetical protein
MRARRRPARRRRRSPGDASRAEDAANAAARGAASRGASADGGGSGAPWWRTALTGRPSVGQIAAVVGLIGSVVGLVFLFKPDWRPQPSPDIGVVEVTAVGKPRPASYRRYLERLRLPAYDLTEQYLSRRGLLIDFRYEADGFRGERLPIQWELVDANTNERVIPPGTELADPTWDDAVGIEPSTNDEAAEWFVWVPSPGARGTYYVTVTIYQPREGDVEIPLADFETPQFRASTAT